MIYKSLIKLNLLLFALVMFQLSLAHYDLTLVGHILFGDGICRVPISFADMLRKDIKINFISTVGPSINTNGISPAVADLLLKNMNNIPGTVAVMCSGLWYEHIQPAVHMPPSKIKIAYSMFETNKIPSKWVNILNSQFDAVVVPDNYLINVYKSSGVHLPIFVLPIPLYLKDFLAKPLKKKKNNPFIFGMTGGFDPRKNQEMIINAFFATFGNSPYIRLRIHGRSETGVYIDRLKTRIKELGATNIELIAKAFTQAELINFMSSIDCCVLLSKGEGFSIVPREFLALGIPCILSHNTAHITLCKTGFVKGVACPIMEKANYTHAGLGLQDCGQQFNCTQEGAAQALHEVYTHYHTYLAKAQQARNWSKQYEHKNLKKRYLNLVKPQKIILGKKNEITDNYLMTTSSTLYKKYMQALKS